MHQADPPNQPDESGVSVEKPDLQTLIVRVPFNQHVLKQSQQLVIWIGLGIFVMFLVLFPTHSELKCQKESGLCQQSDMHLLFPSQTEILIKDIQDVKISTITLKRSGWQEVELLGPESRLMVLKSATHCSEKEEI